MEKTIYNPDYEALIDWLRTARKSSGLTMRDLCKLLDCSIGHVQKIESGYHRLDALQLVRYCEAIGADVHEGIRILERRVGDTMLSHRITPVEPIRFPPLSPDLHDREPILSGAGSILKTGIINQNTQMGMAQGGRIVVCWRCTTAYDPLI